MACSIKKNKEGQVIGAVAPNGKPSKLFNKLVEATGSTDAAYTEYAKFRTKARKDEFGQDWEDGSAVDSIFTDDNGEPILAKGEGYYYVVGPKGRTEYRDLKNTSIHQGLNISYEVEKASIDTIIMFLNDIKNSAPDFFNPKEVNKLFNKTKDSDKGYLADMLLTESFGLPLNQADIARDLFNTLKTEGVNAMNAKMPENANMQSGKANLFLNIYDQWEDIPDPVTGNIIRTGWRTKIQNELSSYGMKLNDATESIEMFDEDYVRIHDVSRLQESPKDKMSSVVRGVLTDVRRIEPNILGYQTALSLDEVYSEISEATVGQTSFKGMINELVHRAQYKPALIPVIEKIKTLSAQQQAAFYSNFNNSYKSFLQFKSTKYTFTGPAGPESAVKTEMFNSNESDTARRYRTFFNRQSKEYKAPNERALYKIEEDANGNEVFKVKDSKLSNIKNAFNKVEKVKRAKTSDELPQEAIDGLAEMLWEMSMQFGSTLEETKQNLTKYFTIGDPAGNKGIAAFKNFVFAANEKSKSKSFEQLIVSLEKNKNIYSQNGKIINKISGLAPLFDGKAFGSFISGTGKQYYPINEPTPLDELQVLMQTEGAQKLFDNMSQDPFYSPGDDIKNKSILLSALSESEAVRDAFNIEVMDSYKASNEGTATNDYGNQSAKTSLIVRLNAYANNSNKTFTKIAMPTQADRKRLDFVTLPRVEALAGLGVNVNKNDIIKGFIIQDLSRIAQAKAQITEAAGDKSKLIEGYHYAPGKDVKDSKGNYTGTAFKMTQINGLQDSVIESNGKLSRSLSDVINQYLEGTLNPKLENIVEKLIQDEIDRVDKKLKNYTDKVNKTIKDYNINLSETVHKDESSKPDFIENFVFNDFVHRIELAKMVRGGFSFAKNGADYYKRTGLYNTPGKKLMLKGDSLSNKTYGMMPTYGEITIKDFDFSDPVTANKVADTMRDNLVDAGVSLDKANTIADGYRSVNKSDAQGIISTDMYRGIMMGIGEWTMQDEQAFRNEKAGNGYVDNEGNARPIYPIKPYHEELHKFQIGEHSTMAPIMDKNSYMVLTSDMASITPEMQTIYDRLQEGDVQVINTESATKGARVNVQDVVAGDLNTATVTKYDSSKLRLPQIMPKSKKKRITFSRQVRKNVIANIKRGENYQGPWGSRTGQEVFDLFQQGVAENIAEDTKNLKQNLGLTKLEKANLGTAEYAEAKLEHLKKIRKRLKEQVLDKDLPENYIKALNIVPNGPYDFRFEIPLAFPNYQAKFEQIFFSMYNKDIFLQTVKGKELVQIAELGGSEVSGDLKMYDGSSPAQVRVKASVLGLEPGTRIEDVDQGILDSIGYRIPNQGKNSMLPMTVVEFLPESHEKAIMVPGGVTQQMGSDFDVDKMYMIQPETALVEDKLTRVKPNYSKAPKDMTRQERDAMLFDVMESIMKSPQALEEVITPLDSQRLLDLVDVMREGSAAVDYNDPLIEVDMEQRNKAGVALRGLWANALAGRNTAQAGDLQVNRDYAPTIDYNGEEITFFSVARERDYVPGEGYTGDYTDYSISAYLSAAVDAAKDPIQIDINDNVFTVPVASLMISTGVPVEDVVYFLAQPGIKKAIEFAQLNDYTPGSLTKAVNKIIKDEYKGKVQKKGKSQTMSSEALRDLSGDNAADQVKYLNNFNKFFLAGRNLTSIYKVITPDNLDNVNEMSAIVAWIDSEDRYTKSEFPIISGAEAFQEGDTYPIAVAYRGIFNTLLEGAKDAGFINNSPAFQGFKSLFKEGLNKFSLSSDQHKFIDRALFLKLMSMEGSPFADGMSRVDQMYTNPNNNIATRLLEVQKNYPKLAATSFVQALEPGIDNNTKDTKVYTIKFDNSFQLSAHDKNVMSSELLKMLKTPEKYANDPESAEDRKIVRNFAKSLVYNQLMTTGFKPGGYADMIPTEVFTTRLLFEDKNGATPVEYFSNISKQLEYNDKVFNEDFLHDFVANYGLSKPGGTPLLPTVRYKGSITRANAKGEVLMPKDPKIYDDTLGYTKYFVTFPPGATPKIFTNVSEGVYIELQQQGSGPVHEIGVPSAESTINKTKSNNSRKTYSGFVTKLNPNQIFVFGSNPEGRHGAGAAKTAMKFGAIYGQGKGMQGQAYALPTKDLRVKENKGLRSISAQDITKSIAELYKVAINNPNKEFLVNDYSGKNLNGYSGQEMANMFINAGIIPSNIIFNDNFNKLIFKTQSPTSAQMPGPNVQYAKPLEDQAADDANNSQEQPQKVCKI